MIGAGRVLTIGLGYGSGFLLTLGMGPSSSSPYLGAIPRENFQERARYLWPLPHISDRGPTAQEDRDELEEMVRIYMDWRNGN